MRKRKVSERVFECPHCGEKTTAYKSSNKMTGVSHTKTMWCWKCKEVRDLVQIKNY